MTAPGETFARDGVALLPAALDEAALAEAKAAYAWSLAHPGPLASRIPTGTAGEFRQDLYNPDVLEGYGGMLARSPLPALIAEVWSASPVWFLYEQVFLKSGPEAVRRTPWHQDSSYLAIGGAHLAVAWIPFEPLAAEASLEFVRGSHRGPLYNASRFELGDDTAPLHQTDALPRLPDIEARRAAFDIVSFAVEPGDVVLFHPRLLHGGAPTAPGERRRTLSLRFFGPDAVFEPRPGRVGPRLPNGGGPVSERLRPGEPLAEAGYEQVWPCAA